MGNILLNDHLATASVTSHYKAFHAKSFLRWVSEIWLLRYLMLFCFWLRVWILVKRSFIKQRKAVGFAREIFPIPSKFCAQFTTLWIRITHFHFSGSFLKEGQNGHCKNRCKSHCVFLMILYRIQTSKVYLKYHKC